MIAICPLNSIYSYNKTYLPRYKHIEFFNQVLNENNILHNDNIDIVSKALINHKLNILPYVKDEILLVLQQANIPISFVAESEEELQVIKIETKVLNITEYVHSYLIISELSNNESILISEDLSLYKKLLDKT